MTFLRFRKMPGHRQREQDPGQGQQLRERDHERFSASIFTMRTRSAARTATCLVMSCTLCPARAAHGQRRWPPRSPPAAAPRRARTDRRTSCTAPGPARGCCCSRPAGPSGALRHIDAQSAARPDHTHDLENDRQRGEPAQPGEAREAGAQLIEVDVEHHDDEQEQHHHRAHVDQHQHDREELRLDQQPDGRRGDEAQHQRQRRIHRVARDDHAQRGGDQDGPEDVEQNLH